MYTRRNTLNSNRLLNIRAMFYGEGKKKGAPRKQRWDDNSNGEKYTALRLDFRDRATVPGELLQDRNRGQRDSTFDT